MYTRKYKVSTDIASLRIIRIADNASVLLQGDDRQALLESIDPIGHVEYPYGPFSCIEEHLDYLLTAYDELMQPTKAEGTHNA